MHTTYVDMAATEPFINPEGQLLVDGEFPSDDAQRIVFQSFIPTALTSFRWTDMEMKY
jgi:hypothetical protein